MKGLFGSYIIKNGKREFSYSDQLMRILHKVFCSLLFAILKYANISQKRYIIIGN